MPALKAAYEREPLIDREAVTWALGYVGDDSVAAVLLRTLTEEFKGQRLTGDERGPGLDQVHIMEVSVLALGLLSNRSNTAFDILTRGVDPRFWQHEAKWRSAEFDDDVRILAGYSIVGLALSGRPGTSTRLQALRSHVESMLQSNVGGERDLTGNLLDAAFYDGVIEANGRSFFLGWYFAPPSDVADNDGKRKAWYASADGAEWKAWYDSHQAGAK